MTCCILILCFPTPTFALAATWQPTAKPGLCRNRRRATGGAMESEAPMVQSMDLEAVPQQLRMLKDPKHGAFSAYQSLGEGAAPAWNDSMYSKLCCVTAGIGSVAGKVIVGEETNFCCIQSQLFCGCDEGDGCPAANGGCFMYKPEVACSGAAKIFCLKLGFDLPKAPLIVCCKNEIYGG
ncbi:unnamed protein product [Durusdinium trenchii]|uniref:Uncharacterized protein n=3 Tax=Durusdinium trenchii TaxID=1381693 RepID=A0ABP0S1Y3_9DINO